MAYVILWGAGCGALLLWLAVTEHLRFVAWRDATPIQVTKRNQLDTDP